MEQIISKEEFDELMKIKGEAGAFSFHPAGEFIIKETGEEGLKKLEDIMAKFGYPIKYKERGRTDFYPIGMVAIRLLFLKRLFNFSEEKFREMGRFESKASLIIRIFMRYFVSLERVTKEIPKMWRRYFTVGDLKTIELNKEKKYTILRLENFHLHPLHCHTVIGYFSSLLQMITKSKQVFCEETKCVHRGDKYHEFLLKW